MLLFIAEKGIEEIKKEKIEQRVKSEFTSGQNVYITTFIEFVPSILILLGEDGRIGFISRIGPELDLGNSSIVHRKAWAKLLREV